MPGQCPHSYIFFNVNPWAIANNSEFSICIYNAFEYGQLNLVTYKTSYTTNTIHITPF